MRHNYHYRIHFRNGNTIDYSSGMSGVYAVSMFHAEYGVDNISSIVELRDGIIWKNSNTEPKRPVVGSKSNLLTIKPGRPANV